MKERIDPKSNMVSARTIKHSEPVLSKERDESALRREKALARIEHQEVAGERFTTLAAQVAGSNVYMRNWYPDQFASRDRWPGRPRMWYVSRYFPFAKGGPLLVDEPTTELEAEACREKQKALKKQGFRHVVIIVDDYKNSEGGLVKATRLDEALEQLGEMS